MGVRAPPAAPEGDERIPVHKLIECIGRSRVARGTGSLSAQISPRLRIRKDSNTLGDALRIYHLTFFDAPNPQEVTCGFILMKKQAIVEH